LAKDETIWPSPEALKRKVIVKGKKLPPIEMDQNLNSANGSDNLSNLPDSQQVKG